MDDYWDSATLNQESFRVLKMTTSDNVPQLIQYAWPIPEGCIMKCYVEYQCTVAGYDYAAHGEGFCILKRPVGGTPIFITAQPPCRSGDFPGEIQPYVRFNINSTNNELEPQAQGLSGRIIKWDFPIIRINRSDAT